MDKRNENKTEIESSEKTAKENDFETCSKNSDAHLDDSSVVTETSIVENNDNPSPNNEKVVKKQPEFSPEEKDKISKRQRIFKTVTTWVFIIFVVGVFVYTFYNDFFANDKEFPSWEKLADIFKSSWQYFLYAIICIVVFYLFKGLKLSLMCKSTTGKFKFKTCFETGIIGMYYNCVTPLAVGGQPFEIYHLSKHGVHGGVASAIPIATFFLNQFAFVSMGVVALILFKTNVLGIPSEIVGVFPTAFSLLAIIGLVCCLIMPLLVIVFSMMPKVGSRLVAGIFNIGAKLRLIKNPQQTTLKTTKNLFHNASCLKKVFTSPLSFFISFILSIGERLAEASIAYFSLCMFGYDLVGVSPFMEWLQVVQIAIILYASISFIPTPGNSGAADLSFYLLFEVGLLAGLAFPAMVTWRVISFYSHIIIGFIFITVKKKSDHIREKKHLPLE